MREHLYRGFYKDEDGDTDITFNGETITGKWVEGLYHKEWRICMDGETCVWAVIDVEIKDENGKILYIESYKIIPETVCDYACLTDKNGKKIFEGDIVKDECNNYARVAFLPQECGYVLVYKKFDTRLGHRNRGGGYFCDMALEVIGNIFES